MAGADQRRETVDVQLLATLEQCMSAWQAIDWARSQRDGRLDQLERQWTHELEELASAHNRTMSDDEHEELQDALAQAWATNDLTQLERWPELLSVARRDLDALGPQIAAAAELERQALDDTAPVRARLADHLHQWLRATLDGDTDAASAWPSVLHRWRTGMSMPMREAAEVLGVSAAAIAQWEKGAQAGGRAPSLTRLTDVVGAMTAIDVPPDTSLQRSRRVIERITGQQLSWQVIEQRTAAEERSGYDLSMPDRAELDRRLHVAAAELDDRRAAVLVALAESADALSELAAMADRDPQAATRAALAGFQ